MRTQRTNTRNDLAENDVHGGRGLFVQVRLADLFRLNDPVVVQIEHRECPFCENVGVLPGVGRVGGVKSRGRRGRQVAR